MYEDWKKKWNSFSTPRKVLIQILAGLVIVGIIYNL